MIVGNLDFRRFDALASYARDPAITLITEEIAWYATSDERLLGIILFDRIDRDFGWVVFARDEALRYRACKVNASLDSEDSAYQELMDAMQDAAAMPDEHFHQGDVEADPVDFFSALVPADRQNDTFQVLANNELYSPARELIQVMMRWHEDVDGNFVTNFQTKGFDARIWELYLYAVFNELNFVRDTAAQVPDFVLGGPSGRLAVEAATANPSDNAQEQVPLDREKFADYLMNYIPIKLAAALKSKLNRNPPYWEQRDLEGVPFCVAVQDFHALGSMRFIVPAVTEYVFGVRHSLVDGQRKIERIRVHRYGNRRAQSGFFFQERAEHISAVIVNPLGTLTKFNRLGHMLGFGNPNIQMVRTGLLRNDGGVQNPAARPFRQLVDENYDETWAEGMVVLHNPRARVPLDPNLLPGINHEFLQEDGSILSWLPEFQPYSSQTIVSLGADTNSLEE